MFYSHEILTSRKHGVATIWLVATLGAKSAVRKVKRKAIDDVDVPKACEIIIEPEAPMALRLQSNLLFGVSTVYTQQCDYLYGDVQGLEKRIKQLRQSVQSLANDLDPNAARVRADQLLLPDDPTFFLELAHTDLARDFNLLDLDLTASSSDLSQLHSSHDSLSSRTSLESLHGIGAPSSGSAGIGADFGGPGDFSFGDDDPNQTGLFARPASGGVRPFRGDDGFLRDVDFSFDNDGNMIDMSAPQAPVAQTGEPRARSRAPSDASAIERVRQQHEDARIAQQQRQAYDQDDGFARYMQDDYQQLQDAEPFPERTAQQNDLPQPASGRPQTQEEDEAELAEDEASSDYATAPVRRKKAVIKSLPFDIVREQSSTTMRSWKDDYLKNMRAAAKIKTQNRAVAIAKKNAEYYVWGIGIGGIGAQLSGLGIPSHLDYFHGDKLRDLVLGIKHEAGQKRDHSSLERDGGEESDRRVRLRGMSENIEQGRNEGVLYEEDGIALLMDDDVPYPEQGRDAPTPLAEDPSSLMPWNMSASLRSSALAGARRGLHSRAGSATSLQFPGASRRLTSASPLLGRGSMLPGSAPGSLMPPQPMSFGAGGPSSASGFFGGDDNGGMGGEEDYQMPDVGVEDANADFEQYGPGAGVNTQTAGDSQWIRKTLDREAENFLDFVVSAIEERTERLEGAPEQLDREILDHFLESLPANEAVAAKEQAMDRAERHCITFAELLEPKSNTNVVAAQGLLHVLTLATKGVMHVQQREDFGEIELSAVLEKLERNERNDVSIEPHNSRRVAEEEDEGLDGPMSDEGTEAFVDLEEGDVDGDIEMED